VRVFTAVVNHLDLDLLAGTSRYEVDVPHTLGMEGAGLSAKRAIVAAPRSGRPTLHQLYGSVLALARESVLMAKRSPRWEFDRRETPVATRSAASNLTLTTYCASDLLTGAFGLRSAILRASPRLQSESETTCL
jgi:hypothetical protein